MSEELSREIRKLEVRLEEFLKEEEAFVKELRSCLKKLKELDKRELSEMKTDELISLRKEVIKAFSEVLKKESKAEHEKSHLLESYGAIILALEGELRQVI